MKEHKNFNLLIVDDEEGIRKALRRNFELEGYNVITADSGNKALEIIRSNKIDFVISDIRMPDGDGEMLLIEIKKMNPEIPVVVLITGFSEMTRKDALSKGAFDLLFKPIDIELLDKYIEDQFNTT